jgi:hypothetical protein
MSTSDAAQYGPEDWPTEFVTGEQLRREAFEDEALVEYEEPWPPQVEGTAEEMEQRRAGALAEFGAVDAVRWQLAEHAQLAEFDYDQGPPGDRVGLERVGAALAEERVAAARWSQAVDGLHEVGLGIQTAESARVGGASDVPGLDRAEAALRGEPVTAAESEAGRQLANDRDWSDTWEPYKPLAADMSAGAAAPPAARSGPARPAVVDRSPVQRALRHAQSRGQGQGAGR